MHENNTSKDLFKQLFNDKRQLDLLQRRRCALEKCCDADHSSEINKLNLQIKQVGESLNTHQNSIRLIADQVADPLLQSIICMRYIDLLKWKDIASSLYYCDRYVKKLHVKALKQAEIILKDNPDIYAALLAV